MSNKDDGGYGPYDGQTFGQKYCGWNDTTTAVILSEADNLAVQELIQWHLQMKFTKQSTYPWHGFLIGLRAYWNSYTPVNYYWDQSKYPVSYTNWHSSQPSHGTYSAPKMCTTILYNAGYTWNSVVCDKGPDNFGFICSKEAE